MGADTPDCVHADRIPIEPAASAQGIKAAEHVADVSITDLYGSAPQPRPPRVDCESGHCRAPPPNPLFRSKKHGAKRSGLISQVRMLVWRA